MYTWQHRSAAHWLGVKKSVDMHGEIRLLMPAADVANHCPGRSQGEKGLWSRRTETERRKKKLMKAALAKMNGHRRKPLFLIQRSRRPLLLRSATIRIFSLAEISLISLERPKARSSFQSIHRVSLLPCEPPTFIRGSIRKRSSHSWITSKMTPLCQMCCKDHPVLYIYIKHCEFRQQRPLLHTRWRRFIVRLLRRYFTRSTRKAYTILFSLWTCLRRRRRGNGLGWKISHRKRKCCLNYSGEMDVNVEKKKRRRFFKYSYTLIHKT